MSDLRRDPASESFWDGPGQHDARRDPEYLLVRDGRFHDDTRELVEELWRKYQPYCGDADFLSRVKREFNALTWQMYVAGCLLEAGIRLERAAPEGPDIKAVIDGRTVWIECIAVEPGEGENAAKRTYGFKKPSDGRGSYGGPYRPPPDEKIELRISGAIWEKTKQRSAWIKKGVIREEDPYVVAVCAGHIPDADLEEDLPRAVKMLYGIEGVAWQYEIGSDKPLETVVVYSDEIKRPGKGAVSRRGFLDHGDLDGISAVIVSSHCIANPPRAIGRDLVIVHNAVPDNPLPHSFLPVGREYWATSVVAQKDHRGPPPEPELSEELREVAEAARARRRGGRGGRDF